MTEWKEISLGEITAHSAFGPRFSGQAYDENGNVATLRTTDIREDGRIEYSSMPLAKLPIGKYSNHLLQKDDIVITRSGRVGTTALFDSYKLPVLPGAFLIRFRLKTDIVLPKYLVYFFNSVEGQTLITATATGSVQQNLNATTLRSIKLHLPDYSEQNRIVEALNSLDSKIDLLHRQNETLEALAETLFRQWFIVETDEKIAIGEIASVSTGKGLKRDEFVINGAYPVLGANGEMGRADRYLTDERLILTGRVGTLGKVKINENEKVWISDNVLIIKPNLELYFFPIYFSLKTFDFENINAGSTQPLATQTDLKKIEMSMPSYEKVNEFANYCACYFQKIKFNNIQIITLTKLRDTLLPKLMRGEVRVEEVQEEMELA